MEVKTGIIGLMSVLLLGSLTYNITNLPENTYVCTTTNEVGVFDKLSSTGKTGYWTEEGVEKSRTCRNGLWEKLKGVPQSPSANAYLCSYEGCIPKP